MRIADPRVELHTVDNRHSLVAGSGLAKGLARTGQVGLSARGLLARDGKERLCGDQRLPFPFPCSTLPPLTIFFCPILCVHCKTTRAHSPYTDIVISPLFTLHVFK
jgi:hypothetical protein